MKFPKSYPGNHYLKRDSYEKLEELTAVKDQLHKMEERAAGKGMKQTLKRAVNKLEEDCQDMKEKL